MVWHVPSFAQFSPLSPRSWEKSHERRAVEPEADPPKTVVPSGDGRPRSRGIAACSDPARGPSGAVARPAAVSPTGTGASRLARARLDLTRAACGLAASLAPAREPPARLLLRLSHGRTL